MTCSAIEIHSSVGHSQAFANAEVESQLTRTGKPLTVPPIKAVLCLALAAQSRVLARRLEALPRMSAALESESVGWSMAELLARNATPQTEAALIEFASAQDRPSAAPHAEPRSCPDIRESRDEAPNEPVQISGIPPVK